MIERYGREVMRQVWTEENKFNAYLKVEILTAEAWRELGVVPAEDVEEGNIPYVVLDAIDADWEAEQKLKLKEDEFVTLSTDDETMPEWKFPPKLGVTIELPDMHGVEIAEESLEMWRFTRNGSARLTHELTVQMQSNMRTITVSDFTGLVEIVETDTEKGHIVY